MLTAVKEHPWVTKDGKDPLLSAEENTANIVEPPTEEEKNQAITGNLSNIVVLVCHSPKEGRGIAKHMTDESSKAIQKYHIPQETFRLARNLRQGHANGTAAFVHVQA